MSELRKVFNVSNNIYQGQATLADRLNDSESLWLHMERASTPKLDLKL
mgnify:CR=1 FL=1